MSFLNNFNFITLLSFGILACLFLNVASQTQNSPSFQCNGDPERPFGFCRAGQTINGQLSQYAVARSNVYRNSNTEPWSFNYQGLVIFEGPAQNTICCDQNYGLRLSQWGQTRQFNPQDLDAHCTVIAT